MKTWELGDQKGIASLRMAERAEPKPGPGQAVIAVKACSLNRRDIGIAGGTYGAAKPATRIPLSDGAGDVVAIGPDVTGVKVGDRVTASHYTTWLDGTFDPSVRNADLGVSIDGWLTERAVIPAAALVPIPDKMSYAEAAALPVAAVTAWSVIEGLGRIKSGDIVLTLGTGGVSIFALQIAKMNGARAAITSSSDEKLARCKDLGADIVVNYKTRPDWDKAIRDQTGGRGVDIVVETGGFATLSQSLAACAPNARVGMIGALAGRPEAPPALFPMVGNNITLKGITSGTRRMFVELLKAMDATDMKPVIDKTFAFDDAVNAYQYMVDSDFIGKIVVSVG
ncbi:MAG: NAD(P)-dependent alcohol dehydrogenase [Rhodobacteraceae bacterium]|nr:NAD(P)-dependent alcohol dehydrogenase [Paracoccaceae bacterium]